MKINIPKVLVPVDLGEYAAELAGNFLQVWVNPPLHIMQQHTDATQAAQAETGSQAPLYEWYAQQWSQHSDPAQHWTAQELEALQTNDPALLAWLIDATWQAIGAHRFKKKKG